jgi:hypothetical protein
VANSGSAPLVGFWALALQPGHRVMTNSIRPSAAFFNSRSSTCKIFNMLRQDKWFNAWLLMAGMEMSDKSSFLRYGYSVDLDRFERFGRSGTRRVSRLLACCRYSAARQSTWGLQRRLSVLICHFDKERTRKTLAPERLWHQKSADTRKGSGTRKVLAPERLWCYTLADASPWVVLHLG